MSRCAFLSLPRAWEAARQLGNTRSSPRKHGVRGLCGVQRATNTRHSTPLPRNHLLTLSAHQVARSVRSGELSAERIATAYLEQVAAVEASVGAYLVLDAEAVLERARSLDARRARGEKLGALAGVPIAVKDNLVTAHLATTAGSRLLSQYTPPYHATCVERLLRADAVLMGKTVMDEFGMGSSTETCAYGMTRNPVDTTRTPGGSSGGSAAAAAAHMALAALGSDTGGSVRQPASFCGVVGMKPSYGRVSRNGLIAYASSLDTVGPMGRTVGDVALCLEAIAGADDADSTCLPGAAPPFWGRITEALAEDQAPLRGKRIGLWTEALDDIQVDDSVRATILQARDTFTALGAEVRPVSLPHLAAACSAYYILASSEASSNLARYDGHPHARAGRGGEAACYVGHVCTVGWLLRGVLSAGHAGAQRDHAGVEGIVRGRRLAVGAGGTKPAFRLGEKRAVDMYSGDRMTVPASLAGLPAISVPGKVGEGQLPVGVQLIGRYLDDEGVLLAAAALERATKA
eukprot:ctg_2359.g438